MIFADVAATVGRTALVELGRRAILSLGLSVLLGAPCVCSAASKVTSAALKPPTDPFAGLPPDSARLKAVRLKLIVGEYGADIDGMEPSVSPDGRFVVFSGWSNVFLCDLRTRKTVLLCRSHLSNAHDFAWNATGTWIAFASAWNDSPGYMPNCIWLVRADGGGLHRIPGSGPNDQSPIWTPDGGSLVWTRGQRLWQSDMAGRTGHFITRSPADPHHFELARGWASDRVHLRYLARSEMGEEFKLRLVGRDSTDDSPDPSRVPTVSRSKITAFADGSLLYRGVENAIEFIEPGAGGRVRRCFVQPDLQVWNVSIAEDRSVAVFEVGDEEEAHLWVVDLRARSRRKP